MTAPDQRPAGPWRALELLARVAGYPELVDDLREGYDSRLTHRGRLTARMWLARQTPALLLLALRGLLRASLATGVGSRRALRRLVARPTLSVPFALVLGGGLAATAFMAEVRDAIVHPRLGVDGGVRLVTAVDSTGDGRALFLIDPTRPWTEPAPAAVRRLYLSRFTSGVAETPAGLLQVNYETVSPGFVTGLGGSLRMGRDLSGPNEVVLSDAFWRSHWRDGAPALGTAIELDGSRSEVVGIADPDFGGPTCCVRPSFWAVAEEGQPGPHRVVAVGVADSAAAALQIAERLRADGQPRLVVELPNALAAVFGGEGGVVARSLTTLFWLALATLLASVLNGGNLLVADALDRRDEVAVRRSIGASPAAIVGLVAHQAVWLAAAGAGVGLLLTWTMTRAAPHLLPIIGPDSTLDLDLGALGSVVVLAGAALAATLCTLPAAVVVGTTAASARRRGTRVSGVMVSAQAALGTVLVILTGMLMNESRRLDGDFVGFRQAGVGVFPVRAASSDGALPPDRLLAAGRGAADGVPAALTRRMPVYGASEDSVTLADGRRTAVFVEESTPEFFEVLGLRLTAGRAARDAREAVVSEDLQLASAPLGATLMLGDEPITVVGVAESATWARGAPRPTVYRGWAPEQVDNALLLLRTPSGGAPTLPSVAAALTPIGYAVTWFGSMRDLIVRSRVLTVFLQRLATVFSGLCLLVVVTGVYAHFTRWVRSRHRELGIRHALGARPARLRGAVYAAAGPGLAFGITVGVAVAWYLGRSAATVLGVDAPGVALLGTGAAVVSVTALASLVPPAWRVVRYEPRRLLTDE